MEEEKKIEEISHDHDDAKQEETNKQGANVGKLVEDGRKEKEEAQVEEKGVEINSLKKPKQSLVRTNSKAKVTVPKPFSLATDQRKMARERRVSVDGKDNAPKFTRSSSMINHKVSSQVSKVGERTSMLSRTRSVITTPQGSLAPKATTNKLAETKLENGKKENGTAQSKESEKIKPKLDSKVDREVETKKLMKSNTFKALSLPSFYKKKDLLPSPEEKKIAGKDANSTAPNKSKSITSSAKQTISKLLKTTRKNHTKPDETVKVAVLSNA